MIAHGSLGCAAGSSSEFRNGKPRILLVAPPLHRAYIPSLAIEQLAQIARGMGYECETIYAMLRMPGRFPQEMVEVLGGPAAFAASYYSVPPEQVADELAIARLHADGEPGIAAERVEATAMRMLVAIDAAEECVARTLADIPLRTFDVVGFSVAFDAQKLPAACLAKALKQREPQLKIIFGGTGCDGVMAPALLELFEEVDAVVAGDAEHSFIPVIEAVAGASSASKVAIPGAYLRGCAVNEPPSTVVRTANLDQVPTPDYRSFFEQLAKSEYSDSPRFVMFETSRGCWWGAKHHCRFCGILAVSGKYRSKAPAAVVDQIATLAEQWVPDVLYSTDAILDMAYFADVLPDLAKRRQEHGWTFECFFEVKSNLKRRQVAALASAGITWLQPGIESFSSDVLRLVGKGATCLQQIELLKWVQAYGMRLSYGLLVGVPGETLEDYEALITTSRRLHHLPPPASVNRLGLHRFSPYFDCPEAYGIYDIRPSPVQRITYRGAPDALLRRACYSLDYSCDSLDAEASRRARLKLKAALVEWQRAYVAGLRLVVAQACDGIIILRRGEAGELDVSRLYGPEAAVYRALVVPKSLERLAVELNLPAATVATILAEFDERGWIIAADGKYLGLAVPAEADAQTDAAFDHGSSDSCDSAAAELVHRDDQVAASALVL